MSEVKTVQYEATAKKFVMALTTRNRRLVHWKTWDYLYDGRRYVMCDDLDMELRRWLLREKIPQTNTLVNNVLPIARALTAVATMPQYQGSEDWPKNCLAYTNGVLDLNAWLRGEVRLLNHTPNWIDTFCLSYEFRPESACPMWLAFLDQVFGDDRILFLQQWMGYCLVPGNKRQVFTHWQGPPNSGRSTICRLIKQLVGEEYATGFKLTDLAGEHGTPILVGKQVAVCGETDLSGHRGKRQIMKQFNAVIGGDQITINQKNKPIYSTALPVKFIVLSNQDVNFVDHSGAVARRLLPLPFDKNFENNQDLELDAKLLGELDGIGQWALAGLRSLHSSGKFHEPAVCAERKLEQRRNNSDVFAFLMDMCCIQKCHNPGNLKDITIVEDTVAVPAHSLELAWSRWWLDQGKDPRHLPTMDSLGRALKGMVPKLDKQRGQADVTGRRPWLYWGIGLLDPANGLPISNEEKLRMIGLQ